MELGEDRLLFGRGLDCDIQLAGTEASRHHAEVQRVGPLLVLRDLGSRNGTFVNGVRVSEAPLTAGSVVRMGDWLGVVASEGHVAGAGGHTFTDHGVGLWGGRVLGGALAPAKAAASSDLPIIIEGETGTGKELAARAIHAWSGRSGSFIAINCGALPDALVEGELFGYRRGAFTGADRSSPGHFRAAEGGTLLLDEICELSPAMQVKLLRLLEQREVVPLGESRPVPIDVRIVAAAQEPLQRAVEQQHFRADLYARLDGLTLRLPPLRERIADVPRLLARFLAEESDSHAPMLSINALEVLCLYDWPFNVRELRLLGRRLEVLHRGSCVVGRAALPQRMRERQQPVAEPDPVQQGTADLCASELDRLLAALRRHRGNVSRAARAAGISRNRAYRVMNANPAVDVEAFRCGDPQEEV